MGIVVAADGQAKHVHTTAYGAISESITDVARQIEDLNWVNLSTDRPSYDLIYDDRKRLLQRIRLYRRRSPLAKQAAALLQHYVLGQGITLKANNKAKVARIVDEFWEDPVNQAVFTSHQSQKEAIDALFTDGDIFLVLFPDTVNGTLQLGFLDALFVEDIITDPENSRVARWYKARKPDDGYNFGLGTWEARTASDFTYYRDWRNPDEGGGKGNPPKRLISEGLVYHVRINKRGKFGESDLAAALDWLKAHKDFMEDRASLSRAAAQIAWKKKRKGPAGDLQAEVARMQSSLVNNISRYESNPPAGSASTIVENEGSTMDWVKTDTGGANALADERILRMMAGSGMGGIPNHYFGDEANANLATATAMELPLLKTYEDWQKLWSDVVSDIIGFVLSTAHEAGRIGERDDSRRYAERVLTPRQVLNTGDVAGPASDNTRLLGAGTGAKPAAPPSASAPTSASTASPMKVGEADVAPPAGAAQWPRDPTFAITLIPKHEPEDVLLGANDTSGAVDWFVDVDFAPILQKDTQMMMGALKTFYEFLPTGNIESQKLVVETALMLMGQNNIDEVMERLFPVDLPPQPGETSAPNSPEALMRALAAMTGGAPAAAGLLNGASPAGLLGPGQATTAASPAITPGTADKQAAVAESLSEYRIRRVLKAARQAVDALDAVGS